jgi:hypothetical protein
MKYNTSTKFSNGCDKELNSIISSSMFIKKFKQYSLTMIKEYFKNSIGIFCEDSTGLDVSIVQYIDDIFYKKTQTDMIGYICR